MGKTKKDYELINVKRQVTILEKSLDKGIDEVEPIFLKKDDILDAEYFALNQNYEIVASFQNRR